MEDSNFTYMHSKQLGAPQANGASGSEGQMLQILDAALINGFNEQTVQSVTTTSNTATLSFGSNHGYIKRQLVSVSGATDAALNGRHRIVDVLGNKIVIDASGVTQITGAIKTRVAALGWESIFGATSPLKRAYRSLSETSTKTVLYLDMSLPSGHGYNATNPAKRAMVSLCEDMTNIGVQLNSYTDIKNNYTSNPNGSLFWYQARSSSKTSSVTTTANASWVIVGNGEYFYFFNEWTDNSTTSGRGSGLRDLYGFGDFPSFAGASDRHNCAWIGSINANDASSISYSSNGARIGGKPTTISNVHGIFISNYAGVGGVRDFVITPDGRASLPTSVSGYEQGSALFPNPSSQSVIGLPLYALTDGCLRASIPRLLAVPQNIGVADSASFDLSMYDDLLMLSVHYAGGGALYGYYCINIGD